MFPFSTVSPLCISLSISMSFPFLSRPLFLQCLSFSLLHLQCASSLSLACRPPPIVLCLHQQRRRTSSSGVSLRAVHDRLSDPPLLVVLPPPGHSLSFSLAREPDWRQRLRRLHLRRLSVDVPSNSDISLSSRTFQPRIC